jgi:hypothetical protein
MNKNKFDYPIFDDDIESLAGELIKLKHEIHPTRWGKNQSIDFYKGMYASLRIWLSVINKDSPIGKHVQIISFDIIHILKNKMDNKKKN